MGVSCRDCHGPGSSVCRGCHGGLDNDTGAPPLGLRGETSTDQLAVGAHTAHIDTTSLGAPVACDACHVVPLFLFSPTHLDQLRGGGLPLDSIAEVVWHGFADGGDATWDRSSRTCAGTYCHGNFSGGTETNAPVWTENNQANCGSCHDVGENPEQLEWEHEYHMDTVGLFCADCHASVVDTLLNVTNAALHVNGQVDTLVRDRSTCNVCHGSGPGACLGCHGGLDNETAAPPYGLRGETSTNQLAVGAHTTHMEGGNLADAFACSDCHKVPSSLIDPSHLGVDSIAELTWSSLAGPASSWNRSSAACSGVYCHGNFSGGITANRPVWTSADQAECGSCHDVGTNPGSLSGRHDDHVVERGFDCIECHSTVVSRTLVILGPALHVNGSKNVSFLRGGTYSNGSCSGLNNTACHGSESWHDYFRE